MMIRKIWAGSVSAFVNGDRIYFRDVQVTSVKVKGSRFGNYLSIIGTTPDGTRVNFQSSAKTFMELTPGDTISCSGEFTGQAEDGLIFTKKVKDLTKTSYNDGFPIHR